MYCQYHVVALIITFWPNIYESRSRNFYCQWIYFTLRLAGFGCIHASQSCPSVLGPFISVFSDEPNSSEKGLEGYQWLLGGQRPDSEQHMVVLTNLLHQSQDERWCSWISFFNGKRNAADGDDCRWGRRGQSKLSALIAHHRGSARSWTCPCGRRDKPTVRLDC